MTTRLIIARPLPGTVGETRRVVHLFPLPADATMPQRLTAYCDTTFGSGELELLEHPIGMPCVVCLQRSPRPTSRTAGGRVVTPPVQAVLPTFQQELDPLLLMPVRLFIACLLADGEWSDDIAVRSALQLGERSFTTHVECLRAAGYLKVRTQGNRKKLRLTSVGRDRFAEHVGALSQVTFAAVKLLPTTRRPRGDADE